MGGGLIPRALAAAWTLAAALVAFGAGLLGAAALAASGAGPMALSAFAGLVLVPALSALSALSAASLFRALAATPSRTGPDREADLEADLDRAIPFRPRPPRLRPPLDLPGRR
jgi:histidine ammonia-lyase